MIQCEVISVPDDTYAIAGYTHAANLQPGAKGTCTGELVESLPDMEYHLFEGVVGRFAVASHAQEQLLQSGAVDFDQAFEGALVATCAALTKA